jgi:YHS domain-containing protein
MSDTSNLLERIDAEFQSVEQNVKQYQAMKLQEYEGRQRRMEQFAEVCDRLRDVWRPRLEAFAEKFRDRMEVTPSITKSRRSVCYQFKSQLAMFEFTLRAMTDEDVRHLILDSTLDILPILMKFEKHHRLELPLEDVDAEAVGQWIDDRILEVVRTYLQMHQNSYYLKGHLVTDPVANVQFPKYAAGATLERNGKTLYFIGEETRDEYVNQDKITV